MQVDKALVCSPLNLVQVVLAVLPSKPRPYIPYVSHGRL